MASPPPFPVEDQTDEDFFDKLVVDDDDVLIAGSHSESSEMGRAFSDLSIGDEDARFATKEEDQQVKKNLESFEAPKEELLVTNGSVALESLDSEKKKEMGSTEDGSQDSLAMGGGRGHKGTSVKEVQWSSFSVDSEQFGSVGFGSDSDFLTENIDFSVNGMSLNNNDTRDAQHYSLANEHTKDLSDAHFWGNSIASSEQQNAQFCGLADENTTDGNNTEHWGNSVASSEQQDAQIYGFTNEQTADVNNSQYWENLYPGWKYDTSTGQWYQIDSLDSTADAQSENYPANVLAVGDELVSDHVSDISYMQQSTTSVTEIVGQEFTTQNVSNNRNQVSQGSAGYPPNMVLDPQYPEWYYDTNTQQWCTLESYNQSLQKTADLVWNQPSQMNASNGFVSNNNSEVNNEAGQDEQSTTQGFYGKQDMGRDWNGSMTVNNHIQKNIGQPDLTTKGLSSYGGHQERNNFYSSVGNTANNADQQTHYNASEPVLNTGRNSNESATGLLSFAPVENAYQFGQPKVERTLQEHLSHSYYGSQNSVCSTQQQFQGTDASYSQYSYAGEGRSSAGRPAHALVTFGFGGKLVIMKDGGSFGTKLDYGGQDAGGATVSILSLVEVMMVNSDPSNMNDGYNYIHTLCQQSFPGPLVGGNAATKDIYKWIDEMIARCKSSIRDVRKGEPLRLLLSLLKISCQHYGKLRSPFGADPSLEEVDGPESAITKLFASARMNGAHPRENAFTHCVQNLPSEEQIRATALEVQNLLVSGRRKEALHCAQAGQLWGPALLLGAQLGEKFYVDTVKQMAQHQFISGSPLRTLCLLIAGQPADVFSAKSSASSSLPGAVITPQHCTEIGMLDDWKQNLAIITANRTKDDELVLVHLGDCLWKEKGEITAAHTCYLVAEANIESYSDNARLCLIGADHWNCPRTYANPEAIQRTELYEHSKVLGNSQFILLQFQPYKFVYACMLAEVGKISDSLRYCQACLKLLKNSGHAPEVELWKSLLSSLEERLRTNQEGGYSTNLAPAKLVGKLFTSIDRSIHRMMGAPSSLPPVPRSSPNGKENYHVGPKVTNSQSTMAMSSLVPSASVEGISEWTGNDTRKGMHGRSISEPDFGRTTKQDSSKGDSSADAQSKASPSRLGLMGSQLLQKTIGWVSRARTEHQAKLGESNKFYYDEKLKRWVEEGAEPPAEEAALPPPPTTASFQNITPDYNINDAFKSPSLAANGPLETISPITQVQNSSMPPISPSPSQFSARSRMGIRSRYVDTFNQGGGGASKNSFHSPAVPSNKPAVGAKFFVPTAPATPDEKAAEVTKGEGVQEISANSVTSTMVASEVLFSSPPPSLRPSSSCMQRFPSMNNISPFGSKETSTALQNVNGSVPSHLRAASWSGNYGEMCNSKMIETMFSGDGSDLSSSFMPSNLSSPLQPNGGSLGDDLHEVEL